MISRKSVMAIANAYTDEFSSCSTSNPGRSPEKMYRERLYDYLYEHEYQAWTCNASEKYWFFMDSRLLT